MKRDLSSFLAAVLLVGVVLIGLTGCAGGNGEGGNSGERNGVKTVLFGAAVSGFQADMGCPSLPPEECDDPNSDWYQFVTSPETVRKPLTFLSGQDPAEVGPGEWELYESDFDLAAHDLNLNAFRMSLEWSRIFPQSTIGMEGYENLRAVANQEAVQHYHRVFEALRARGLKPLVTLNHYTLPTWIHDGVGCNLDFRECSPRGWLDKETTVNEIAKYAGFVAREFGDEVDLWATMNEPFAVLLPGFLFPSPERSNPPAVFLRTEAVKTAFAAMIEAHVRMYDSVKQNDTFDADGDGLPCETGIVYAISPVVPKDAENPLDRAAADNVFYIWNMAFLNAVVLGEFDENLDGHAVLREDLAGRMDYMGLNYYARITVEGIERSFLPRLSPLMTFNPLTLAFGVYPRGIYEICELIRDRFGLPVYVTENNGRSDPEDDDEREITYLREHLGWLSLAQEQGVDVRGYFYWSLVDNFEWNQGMKPYGLYEVDPGDPAKTRRARPIVQVYAEIARKGVLPNPANDKHPPAALGSVRGAATYRKYASRPGPSPALHLGTSRSPEQK